MLAISIHNVLQYFLAQRHRHAARSARTTHTWYKKRPLKSKIQNE